MSQRKKEKETIRRIKEKYAEWITGIEEGGISKDFHKEPKKPKLGRNSQKKEEER